MRKFLFALATLAGFWASDAHAQNPTCPTRPVGDSTNACASTAFVGAAITNSSNVIAYIPVVGDNTAALNAATAAAAAAKAILQFPCTTIQATGPITVVSNMHWRGCGKFLTTLQKTPNSGVFTFINGAGGTPGSPISNVTLEDMTLDAQGSTQGGNFYLFNAQFINYLSIYRVRFINPYISLLYIFQDDTHGLGPGGKPLQPNGQQYNSNIIIQDCIFDGSTQVGYGDMSDIITTTNAWVRNNLYIGSGADCLSFEFSTNIVFDGNTFQQCWVGLYVETSYNMSVTNNSWYLTGTSHNGDVPTIGVWLTDANQTYPTGGYNGSHDIVVSGNHFHDVQRLTGTTGEIGVLVQGPIITAPITAGAVDIDVSHNDCFNVNDSTASGVCVLFAGVQTRPVAIGNVSSFTDKTLIPTQAYTASGYGSAQSTSLARFSGNSPIVTAPTFVASNGFGTGPTITIASGSTDESGQINITTGTAPSASGNVTVNLSTVVAQNILSCQFTPVNVGAGWTSPILYLASSTIGTVNSQFIVGWQNSGALTASSTYAIQFKCLGS